MKQILAAKKKPVEDWELGDLDLDLPVGLDNAWSRVETTEPKPPKEAGKQVTDDEGSGAAALTEFLVAGKYL